MHTLHRCFNSVIVSLTCSEQPSVYPLEDFYLHKTACTSLLEDKHLDVRKHVEDTMIKLKH